MGRMIELGCITCAAILLASATLAAVSDESVSAQVAQIENLPSQGEVKVTGVVDSIANAKSFILKDSTGRINVSVQTRDAVLLARGAEVTVTGYVSNGAIGKKIDATHVSVTSSVAPAAGPAAGPIATK